MRTAPPSSPWPRFNPNAGQGNIHLAHDIELKHYRDAHPYAPFGIGTRHADAHGIKTELLLRVAREGFADGGPRVRFSDNCDMAMDAFPTPTHIAHAHLYDVNGAPAISNTFIARTHYKGCKLYVHIHPSSGVLQPPDVMTNREHIIIQSPHSSFGVAVMLSVEYTRDTGHILIDEITHPTSYILEALSGNRFVRAQRANMEFLSNSGLMSQVEGQAHHEYTHAHSQAAALSELRHMADLNREILPPQRPAITLTGFPTQKAAEESHYADHPLTHAEVPPPAPIFPLVPPPANALPCIARGGKVESLAGELGSNVPNIRAEDITVRDVEDALRQKQMVIMRRQNRNKKANLKRKESKKILASKVYADRMAVLEEQLAKLHIKYDAAIALEALPAEKGEEGTLLESGERAIPCSPRDPRKRRSKRSSDEDDEVDEVVEELDYGTP
jgi:hypothetical protein